MPLEIEIKLKVDTHEPVRRRLREAGAQPKGTVRETNIFFDRPDNSLRKQDTGLRVRFSQRPGNAPPETLLTAKGPAAVTGLRSREAFDLTLTPHDQIVPLLKMLGFEKILLFEKDRESWQLASCLIELDTLPHFGPFVEIEGPSELAVMEVQQQLHLSDLEPHRPSYSRMVGQYLEREAITNGELRFAQL